jgi:hypothetical protein
MTTSSSELSTDWFAMHIHLSDGVLSTRFLVEWMYPRIKSLLTDRQATSWFFIRYWDGGPHLRVRLKGIADEQRKALLMQTSNAVRQWCSPTPPSRETYYRAHNFDGAPVDIDKLAWREEGAVMQMPYEPEFQRYGGNQAMEVNEQLFALTSTLAIKLFCVSTGDFTARLSQSFSLMPVFALAFNQDPAALATFFAGYADYWSGYSAQTATVPAQHGTSQAALPAQVDLLRRQIIASRSDTESGVRTPQALLHAGVASAIRRFLDLYAEGRLVLPFDGQPVRDRETFEIAVGNMLASQIHMFNNRLGLVPAQEMILARALAVAARELQAEGGLVSPAARQEAGVR